MSSDNNIIQFRPRGKNKKSRSTRHASDKEVKGSTPLLKKPVESQKSQAPSPNRTSPLEGKITATPNVIPSPVPSPVPTPVLKTKPDKNHFTNSILLTTSACCLLLLMAAPFISSQFFHSPNKRELASVLKIQKQQKTEQEKILKWFKNGKRQLASVGRKPTIKEQFAVSVLHSSYDINWNGPLFSHLTLKNGYDPISLPPLPQIVSDYPSLFPHQQEEVIMAKSPYFSDTLEAYHWYNANNEVVGLIEAVRDEHGRVLSIQVQ